MGWLQRFISVAMTVALLCCLAPAAFAKSHAGTFTVTVDLSAHGAGEVAELWLPYPLSDGEQLISDIQVRGDYATAAVYSERAFGTPLLYARWEKGAVSRTLQFTFKAERQELLRRNFPAKEAAWDPKDYALYLQPTSLGPVDGEVGALAARITAGKQGVLAKARAIYDWTCENTYRDPAVRGCGSGDVCSLLQKPGGKCADIHSVFVALARAAGVPAREVFGLRMGKKEQEDVTTWQHCWAEFYLPGYGWVPVDPADVRKAMLTEKLQPGDARTAELRSYFWGGIDPYRVKFSTGRDLTLNPPQPGGPLNYFMYPFARVGGTVLDFLEPKSFRYRITYSAP